MEYYCEEHKYNPPEGSGMAFCPFCEFPKIYAEEEEFTVEELHAEIKRLRLIIDRAESTLNILALVAVLEQIDIKDEIGAVQRELGKSQTGEAVTETLYAEHLRKVKLLHEDE